MAFRRAQLVFGQARLALGRSRLEQSGSVAAARFIRAPPDCSNRTCRPLFTPLLSNQSPRALSTSQPALSPPPKPSQPRKAALSEDIYTIPNALTVSRILATPVIGHFILSSQPTAAAGLFLLAGATDWLDGHLARTQGSKTVFGSIADPFADKLLMTTVVATLAARGHIPAELAVLVLGRDVSLAVAALYYRYASLPGVKSWSRFWDPSLPTAAVHPTDVSKWNTFLQLSLIMLVLVNAAVADQRSTSSSEQTQGDLPEPGEEARQHRLGLVPGQVVTAAELIVVATTTWSWAEYALRPRTVSILDRSRTSAERAQIGKRGRMVVGLGLAVCAALLLLMKARRTRETTGEDSTGTAK